MLKVKIALVGAAILAALAVGGCSSSDQEHEVLDVFIIQDYDTIPADRRPETPNMIWIKDDSTQKGSRDIFVSKEVWEGCWMGDIYTDRLIGKDGCERTANSVMPTRLKQDG